MVGQILDVSRTQGHLCPYCLSISAGLRFRASVSASVLDNIMDCLLALDHIGVLVEDKKHGWGFWPAIHDSSQSVERGKTCRHSVFIHLYTVRLKFSFQNRDLLWAVHGNSKGFDESFRIVGETIPNLERPIHWVLLTLGMRGSGG